MNVIRVYFVTSAILFIAVAVLLVLGHERWALLPVVASFGLMSMAVAALVEQQQQANQLLSQQLKALIGFFNSQGVKIEDNNQG